MREPTRPCRRISRKTKNLYQLVEDCKKYLEEISKPGNEKQLVEWFYGIWKPKDPKK